MDKYSLGYFVRYTTCTRIYTVIQSNTRKREVVIFDSGINTLVSFKCKCEMLSLYRLLFDMELIAMFI